MSNPFDDFADRGVKKTGDPNVDSELAKNEADRARKAYKRLMASDDLETTIDDNARFLAKMYICAKRWGLLKEYKQLIEDAMRVRPDKVKSVAKVFDSLSLMYKDAGTYADSYKRKLVWGEHLAGDAADGYYAELNILIKHLYSGEDDLKEMAANTADLFDKFGDALVKWRKEIAKAIKTLAEEERNRELAAAKGMVMGLFDADPYAAAKAVLDSLLELWRQSDQDARSSDRVLKAFAETRGFQLDAPKYKNVDLSNVVMPDAWDGSFK